MKSKFSKRILALLLTLAMVLTMIPAVFADEGFSDVPADAWYAEAVQWAVSNEVTSGTGNGKFSPDMDCTRAQVVTFLYRAYKGEKVENPETTFTDVAADAWYADAVNWAVEKKITTGTGNGKFSPDAVCDRSQVVTFLFRASGDEFKAEGSDFTDVAADAWYADAVAWAVENEITTGTGGGKFSPEMKCSRAQIVTFLFRALSYKEPDIGDVKGKIVILHTNDTHGAIQGFANVAAVKARFEEAGAKVILVDAGDFSQGTTYVSTNKGEAAVTMMNEAGYDYVTLGNHEFDFGYEQLKANLAKAEFTALCADVFEKATGESILPAYAIKEIDGVKVGFFGMETPETQTKVNPGLITEIEFGTNENGKFLQSAKDAVAALKEGGADVIVGIVHLGVDPESEPYRSTDLYAELKDDVDFLIDGHSHTVMEEGPNGEPIQSTGTKASKTAFMNVGVVVIDAETKAIEDNYLYPLSEDSIIDEDVEAAAAEIMAAVDAQYGAVFAKSEVELNGDKAPGNRTEETNLGDLITDSMRWSVLKEMDAETLGVPEENVVAITNGGGIRAWIHKGDVTMNDVNTVLPFGNTVAVVYVTGAELLEALEASTYCTPTAVGGFPQISGMKITIDTGREFDEGELYPGSTYHQPKSIKRVTIQEIGGKPFDPAATYAVVTNNFCAAGGDTYYAFKAASAQFDTGLPMDEVLMDYIKTELNAVIGETYAEPQGRINIVETVPGTDFVLSGELKDGDEVVIYNAGHGLAIKNETDNDWYLLGSEVTIDEEKHMVVEPAADVIWTVGVGEDGTYTFTQGENAIVCWPSGNYLELTNKADYEGGVKEWKLKEADKATYGYYIYNATLTGQYGPGWLEFYTKNDQTKLSCYSTSEDRLGLENFGFQFYVKGAEYVEPGPGPGPGPNEGDFVLAEPENGSEVVIYNAGHGLAIKNETDNDWYLMGSAVTVNEEAHKIVDPAADIVWKVATDGNGMYRFTNGDNAITCWVSGNYFELTNKADYEGGVNDWALVEADAASYSYYIKNWSLTGQYGNVWLEFYTKNDQTKLSAYCTSDDRLNLGDFGFQFYVKGAEYVEPGPGPGPGEDKVFVKVTEEQEDWSGTYVIARAKDEATAYVFDGVNDKNENFIEAPLDGDKITASTDCAIVIEKSGEGYTFKSSAGYLNGKVFDGAPSNGLYFENEPKVGTISWAEGLPVIQSEANTVFRFNNKTYTDASYLWFRFFKQDSSVTTDANTYVELYKLDEGAVPSVNKAALKRAIDAARELDPAEFTEESYAAVVEALDAAEAVYANADATQEEVDDATAALNAALDALVHVPVTGEKFALTNSFEDGAQVVIYHPTSGMAVSNADLSESQTNYRAGVAVTPEDGCIVAPDEAIVWTVAKVEGGFTLADKNGNLLSCNANNLLLNGNYTVWELREGGVQGTMNIVNVNAPAGTSGDPRAMEWYANYSEFSCYYLTASNDAFALEIYTKTETPPEQDLLGKIVILHTNDTHGALMGFANAAALKKEYEARGATVLLVDAGDFSQGTTYVSSAKGATAIEVMNAAGYDYVTLGNHEFDFGYAQLRSNLENAEFEVLCADVLLKGTGASAFRTRTIVEIDGFKIGLFGMETPETFTKVNPGLITEITFPQGEEMYLCAQNEVNWLKEEGADVIIGIVHLGVDDESAPNRSIDLYNHVTGIDFLIDGHSHTVMTEGPNGEPIQSTGTKADKTMFMNVGCIIIDPTAQRKDGRITNELIPITADTPKDEATAAVAQRIMDAVDAEYGAVFATSEVELNGDKAPGNRNMETNLGDLITDSMAWGVLKDMDAETLGVPAENVIAITNGGGIRAWIHAGDVTKNDINTVLPFGNTIAVVYVTGAELLEALEASTYSTPGAVGGFPQVSGIRYNIDTAKAFDQGEQYPDSTYYAPASIQRVTILDINGKPFDPEATYAVVTNNFCAAGGDTYYAFKAASSQFDTGIPMDEMLMNYITEELGGVIGAAYAEPQGRITQVENYTAVATTFPSTSNDDIAKYGNVYTSLAAEDFFAAGFTWGDVVTVSFLDKTMDLPVVPTFSYVDQGTAGVFVNKDGETGLPDGRVFVAINMGDFATTNGLATKTTNPDKTYYWTACEGVEFPVPVTITMKEQGGYATEMAIHDINRTNNRADYPDLTDAEFANFREVTTTGMGEKTLYRGSSPINPEIGRNAYADAALEAAGVTVIMNLANDQATAEAYEGFADTYYSGQNIIYLNLGVDFAAADFQAGLANGLRHFAANPGVYYVHCTEGKDRAGFVSALLECLMGATYDEVVDDYLTTYRNYYTVVDGVQQPLSDETLAAIANSNIIKTLQSAFGVEDLKTANLAAEAEEYVKAIGLTDAELTALKANLSGVAPQRYEIVQNSSNSTRFGHLDMNVSVAEFLETFALGDIVTVTVGDYTFDAPVVTNYDDVLTFEHLLRCANGKQVVTLAINYSQIGVRAGLLEPVEGGYAFVDGIEWPLYATVTLKEAGGYAEELAVRAMTRTDNREDYASDEEFANFRAVATTGMGENVLYRSASPISDEIGRNLYADQLAQAAGIKTFINLADNEADVLAGTGHFGSYAASYYATQSVKYLGLPVAFTSAEFKSGLAEGYRFITENEAPYLVHCLEGKDRTGLSIAVLEALMGASLAEIQADYLKTYENYFDVVDGEHLALTDAQKDVVTNIITVNLGIIFDADLATADLKAEAEAYLKEIGLNDEEIAALKAKLGGAAAEPEYVYVHGMGLADGDEIVIVNREYSMALSNADLSETAANYRAGVAVTPVDGVIEDPAEEIIWTVSAAEGGFEFVDAEGHKLSIPSGKNQLVLDGDDTVWTVTPSEATEGAVHIVSATSTGSSGDHRAIEWYSQYNEFSSYYLTASSNEQLFAMDLYLKTDKSTLHEHDWVAGDVDAADCTHQEITHYECSICHETKTEITGEALGHNWGDWTVTIPATCTAAGEQSHTCGRCSLVETEPIDKLDHVDEDGDGKCDNCGADMNASTESYYVKVTDASTLQAGDVIIFVCETKAKACGPMGTNKFFASVDAELNDGKIALNEGFIQITLGGEAGAWTMTTSEGVIGATAAKNLNCKGEGTTTWTIEIDADGNATATVGSFGRILYNVNTPRFMNYTSATNSSMLLPQIYKLVEG